VTVTGRFRALLGAGDKEVRQVRKSASPQVRKSAS
jgi:hypothetical protein